MRLHNFEGLSNLFIRTIIECGNFLEGKEERFVYAEKLERELAEIIDLERNYADARDFVYSPIGSIFAKFGNIERGYEMDFEEMAGDILMRAGLFMIELKYLDRAGEDKIREIKETCKGVSKEASRCFAERGYGLELIA